MNANEIKNKYLQLAQNNQAGTSQFINAQKQGALNQMNSLLQSKYGNTVQYNQNNTWHDYGNAIEGYDATRDNENLARYNYLQTQLENYDVANDQYKEKIQTLADQQAQNSLDYDRARLYGDAALKARGISNQGVAESTRLGISNDYAKANANAYRDYNNGINDVYKGLADANNKGRSNLSDEITRYRDANAKVMAEAVNNATSKSDLQNYYNKFGQYMDAATKLEYDKRVAQLENEEIAKSYGVDVNEGLTPEQVYNEQNDAGLEKRNIRKLDKAIEMVKNGKIKDGEVIRIKAATWQNYLVVNGMLYKTNRKSTIKWKDFN